MEFWRVSVYFLPVPEFRIAVGCHIFYLGTLTSELLAGRKPAGGYSLQDLCYANAFKQGLLIGMYLSWRSRIAQFIAMTQQYFGSEAFRITGVLMRRA
jgi:hypothetical protein